MPPAVPEPVNVAAATAPSTEEVKRSVIGIIYPPPEVRNIVDKTASFVARNGPEFESRIRQNELNNPKFNFLNSGDPYHAYYQHKVKDFREGKAVLSAAVGGSTGVGPGGSSSAPSSAAASSTTTATRDAQDMFRPVIDKPVVVTNPPPVYEFTADPPSISAFDLDVVKLTAQFVARNGRHFLTSLMAREQRNYQFDFLRPQHSLFQYFTRMLEQYTKVLIPPKSLAQQLTEESGSACRVLDLVRYRVEWQRMQEARVRSEQQAIERERVSYAQIDWHDFVVVETVDYQPWEQGHFPAPTTPQLVGQRVLMQDHIDDGDEMQMSDEDDIVDADDNSNASDDNASDDEQRRAVGTDDRQRQEIVGADELLRRKQKQQQQPALDAKKRQADDTQVQDMEQDSDDSDGGEGDEESAGRPPLPPQSALPPPPPQPPKPDQVLVKKYDPKAASRPGRAAAVAAEEFLVSPITGERVPVDRAAEHMRISLLDPRWLEQRDRQLDEKLSQNTVLAAGGDITAHLQNLAERRTDIFGAGDEETGIGKKIGEEENKADEKAIWDGHSSSVSSTTRAARANVSFEAQISQIHRREGLLSDESRERIGPRKDLPGGGGTSLMGQPPAGVPLLPRPPLPPTSVENRTPAPLPPQQPPLPPATPAPPPPPADAAPGTTSLLPRPPLVGAAQTPLLVRPVGQPLLPGGPVGQPLLPGGPVGQPLLPGGPSVLVAPRPPMLLPTRPLYGMHPPNMSAGLMVPMATPSAMAVAGDAGDQPPAAKKPRSEEHLMAEQLWLVRSGGAGTSVTFGVSVPLVTDKSEWRLNGQRVEFTLPLTDTVSVMKARLHEQTGLPPGKQKLSHEGVFFKDSNTLAYYNLSNGVNIQLAVKERGGRKK